ncbi:MAG: apolipoprotein N-acyltransferase [Gemmatimonadota bacterium]
MNPGFSPRQWVQAAAVAVLGVLMYPPFHLILPSFIALVPFIWLLESTRQEGHPDRRAALIGFCTGALTNGLGLWWMAVALYRFSPLSAIGYVLAVGVIAAWWGVTSWAVVLIWRRTPGVPRWVVFTCCWTAMEWLVGHSGDLAFPWLGLGTSLTGYPILVQWADIAGARGVTFWLAACNALLATTGSKARRAQALVAVSVAVAMAYGVWRESSLAVRPLGAVALVQPNVSLERGSAPEAGDGIFRSLLEQSRASLATGDPGLIIWPEASLPGYLGAHPDWSSGVTAFARRYHRSVLLGGMDVILDGKSGFDVYNAAFLYDSTGVRSVYHKNHLVPLVEQIPFLPARWTQGIHGLGSFEPGLTAPILHAPPGGFGVLICFESTFESVARSYRRRGADFLVNIVNDEWLRSTPAASQHAAHLVMRAIETRAAIVRVANSGISETIDPLGVVTVHTDMNTRRTLVQPIETTDVIPLYVRWGDWVGLMVLLATGGLGIFACFESREGEAKTSGGR